MIQLPQKWVNFYGPAILSIIYNLMIGVLLYCFVYTIEKSIRNKKLKFFDAIYMFLILFNQNLILKAGGLGFELFARGVVCYLLFVVLLIIYKEKIVSKTKI